MLDEIKILTDTQWQYLQKRYKITPRELLIAKLACQGMSNKETAFFLEISVSTVRSHLRNMYRYLKVQNKIELLLKLIHTVRLIETIRGDNFGKEVEVPNGD